MIKTPIYIGYGLLAFFIIQLILPFQWPYLSEWQANESYRRWSGTALMVYIALQWLLTLFRMRSPVSRTSNLLLLIHKWIGAFSPLMFFIHSVGLGFGYLLILGSTFFFNFVLGLLNVQIIKSFGNRLFQAWYITHISLSVLITVLAGLHIWVVFYYK